VALLADVVKHQWHGKLQHLQVTASFIFADVLTTAKCGDAPFEVCSNAESFKHVATYLAHSHVTCTACAAFEVWCCCQQQPVW